MKTANQKIIIRENKEQAEAFLHQLEEKYLPAVQNLSSFLKGLGITPTKSLIYSAIRENCEEIGKAYRPIIDADKVKFSSPAMKEAVETMYKDNLNNIRSLVSELFSENVGNQYAGGSNCTSFESLTKSADRWGQMPMNSLSLSPFIEVDENGKTFITEEGKESIMDAFRDYATPLEGKLYEAQKEAAKAINNFAASLNEAGIRIDLDFVPQAFFRRFFNVQRSDDGEYTITERIEGIR